MTWWVVRATQDEVVSALAERVRYANVSPRAATGLVSVGMPDDVEVPRLFRDRDQFQLLDRDGGLTVVSSPADGPECVWSSWDADPADATRVVTSLQNAFGGLPRQIRAAIEPTADGINQHQAYATLVHVLGLAGREFVLPAVVAFRGPAEAARRTGHLFGPTTFVPGAEGWSYLKFPAGGHPEALKATRALAKFGGPESASFAAVWADSGWLLTVGNGPTGAFTVGRSWEPTGTSEHAVRRGQAGRVLHFAGPDAPVAEVEALLAAADAGDLPLEAFLARVGLPTRPARLLASTDAAQGEPVEHLARMSADDIKETIRSAALYAATAPGHAVTAGIATAGGTIFVLLAMAVAMQGHLVGAFALLAMAVLMWAFGYATWHWRGRFLWFPRPPRLS